MLFVGTEIISAFWDFNLRISLHRAYLLKLLLFYINLYMKTKNKVAVIMAVYNTPFDSIKRAIDSVLQQTFQDFELLIIDDGSTNDSQSLILKYAIKHENKITYLRHKNCSQSESINRGILLTNSEYITVIDADDEYKPNHLELCLSEINSLD